MAPRHILWITPGFAAGESDYNCIPPMQLYARALLDKGMRLSVVALDYPYRSDPYDWHGARIYPCNGQNRWYRRFFAHKKALQAAKKCIETHPVDCLHSFWLGPAWYIGRRIGAEYGIPALTTLMGQDVLSENRYLKRLRAGDERSLVALSPFHAQVFYQNTGYKAGAIIPWGIDPSDTTPLDAQQNDRPIDIVGAGSLIEVKNWSLWLRTVRLAALRRPGLRAELIGEGPLRSSLEREASDLGLRDTVVFTGSMARPLVMARMRQARCLLHTARFESFGMILIEAAAQGCQLVGTPVGIALQTAFCADNETELAEKVVEVLNRPPLLKPQTPYWIQHTADQYITQMQYVCKNKK